MPLAYNDLFFQEVRRLSRPTIYKIYATQTGQIVRGFITAASACRADLVSRYQHRFREKKGKKKNPHAFCIDLTRDGPTCACSPTSSQNDYWMSTIGTVRPFRYSSINIPAKLPYVLRTDKRVRTLLTNEAWRYVREAGKSGGQAGGDELNVDNRRISTSPGQALRYQLLIFCAGAGHACALRRAMSEDPEPDLHKLWWDRWRNDTR